MKAYEHCVKAREDKEAIIKMIAEMDDRELHFNNVHEAMVCAIYNMMVCKEEMRKAEGEEWKEYHRDVEGAIYPEDVKMLSHETAKKWIAKMGEHWKIEETTAVAKKYGITFNKYSEWCFWSLMNMAYSDYKSAFSDNLKLYADWCNEFLIDADGYAPSEKLSRYYEFVVKH